MNSYSFPQVTQRGWQIFPPEPCKKDRKDLWKAVWRQPLFIVMMWAPRDQSVLNCYIFYQLFISSGNAERVTDKSVLTVIKKFPNFLYVHVWQIWRICNHGDPQTPCEIMSPGCYDKMTLNLSCISPPIPERGCKVHPLPLHTLSEGRKGSEKCSLCRLYRSTG